MSMDFADIETMMANETIEQLASETITVHRGRVQGALDPNTRFRPQDPGALETPVAAITSPRIRSADVNGRRLVVTNWTVLASSLDFMPTPEGLVVAQDGTKWRISRVENVLNGRQYRIHTVRIT